MRLGQHFKRRINILCLSTTIVSSLGAPVRAEPIIADGAVVDVPAGTIVDTSGMSGSAGSGLQAINGGTINADGVTVITPGFGSNGAFATDGSKINLTNTTITTSGTGGYGIRIGSAGSTATINNTAISTEGDSSNGAAAENGANLSISGDRITTKGNSANGVYVAGSEAIATVIDATIITEGESAFGAQADDSGSLSVSGGSITTTGENADGFVVFEGGAATVNGTTITTTGDDANGVFLNGAGSTADINDVMISTAGKGAIGVEAESGVTLSLNGGSITTAGESANGVSALFGAAVTLNDTTITTQGGFATGVEASGSGSTAKITNAMISTDGANANGAWASDGANLSINSGGITTIGDYAEGVSTTKAGSTVWITDAKISTAGSTAYGVRAEDGGTLSMSGGSITTKGEAAYGILSKSADSTVTVTNTAIRTEGKIAVGFSAERGAKLSMTGGSITTIGDGGLGIYTAGSGSTATITGTSISTEGANAHGMLIQDGGRVELQRHSNTGDGTLIQVSGAGSNGIIVEENALVSTNGATVLVTGNGAGVLASDGGRVDLAQTFVKSTTGAALKAQSGEGTFNLSDGTTVQGENGILFSGAAGSSATITADGNVTLIGDMVVDQATDDGKTFAAAGTLQADLKNGSAWKGAASGVTGASIDGTSNWLMTGSSDVGTLTNNGTIAFDAANPYKTLTAGSLAMDGGSFLLNTELNKGGAASKTDRIVVTGDATGNGVINIRNNGGTGALTGTGATDGIQVVSVGGASDAEFKLGSAAIVGIYDYQLKKADGQNWYLQSEGKDVVNPPADPVDPKPPVDPGPGTGHVVDIVPGYNIALSAAQNHVLTSLDTFHERLGELRAEDLQDGYHAWMRGIGKTGSYSPKSITAYNGHGFDMTTAGVQIGADYSKSDVFVAGDKLTIGMFGEYANSSFDVRGRTADGSISSKGLGGYATWQQKAPTERKPGTGAYVDAVVKQDWLDFGVSAKSVSGFDLQSGYKGKATTASIEAGYDFDLGNDVVLQPQAQLTWSKVKADSFTDSYGIAVHGQEAESLIGRAGVRLEKTFYFGDEEETVEAAPVPAPKAQKQVKGKKGKAAKAVPAVLPGAPKKKKFVKTVTTYADANVKHEFKGKNGLVASNTGIGNDMGGTRYDVGVGVVARVSENVSLFGRGSVELGGSTNVAGKVSGGLSITW
ncbi:outer membrane autotransporter protein [Ochrobactrum anthropi]|uniref:autotransporter outer membrane beta-barrel domain-containing protein n=1 Tax=Brucella anthropi TaxID=529 RepID=UPI0015F8715B|nr:autotransporter outer membrane beta-barrel domain-containing protein [Brucella anthropi]MBA8862854.1 outer membrane autotransporter protein [Brucella anthropi]